MRRGQGPGEDGDRGHGSACPGERDFIGSRNMDNEDLTEQDDLAQPAMLLCYSIVTCSVLAFPRLPFL